MLRDLVAPLVGAWIEIVMAIVRLVIAVVAPLVGAWIEITGGGGGSDFGSSLPLWERGLKLS